MLIAFIFYEIVSLIFTQYLVRISKGEYPLLAYIVTGHLWPYVFISGMFRGKGDTE
jgi:hypothetical protein